MIPVRQGPTGATGATGATGTSDGAGTITKVTGTPVSFPNANNQATGSAPATATATCSSGTLVGGGAVIVNNDIAKNAWFVQASYPSSATTWTAIGNNVHVANGNTGTASTITAYALCATP